jgi:hypothetical protein
VLVVFHQPQPLRKPDLAGAVRVPFLAGQLFQSSRYPSAPYRLTLYNNHPLPPP